jgi:hypothetical protein
MAKQRGFCAGGQKLNDPESAKQAAKRMDGSLPKTPIRIVYTAGRRL